MEQRSLGRTSREVSVIGLGTWQLGGDWGRVSEDDAEAVLQAAVDGGVTLVDTADVYGDGRSESLIGAFLARRPGHGVTVATKMGRRLEQHPDIYTMANFRTWTDRSRRNLGVETLDLVQLHCPPSQVIEDDATYRDLDALVGEGVIAAYGVSVETCEQALAVIARPHVTNIQIILNPFRLKPLDAVLPAAREAGVAVLARVPLASGLLSGRYTRSTTFAPDDHRSFNRHGEAFGRGETFSGVEVEVGLEATARLAEALPPGVSLPAASLAWIASRPGVTSVIPGARTGEQASANAEAADLLDDDRLDIVSFDALVHEVYDDLLRESVHPHW